jgi:hypothetical protein
MSKEHLYPYFEIVEAAITELGVDAESARLEDEGRWQLLKGDITVIVEVWDIVSEESVTSYVMVFCPMFQISPNAGLQFYRRALELSHVSIGVSYSIFENHLLLRSNREAAGLDANEMLFTILRVGNTAEEHLPELQSIHDNSVSA